MQTNRPPIADKAKNVKSKGKEFIHKVASKLSEDKGKMAEIHEVEYEGQVVAHFIKKDGKVLQSAASSDAQDSGAFEDFSKKVGDKKPVYTTSEMQAAQAGLAAKKEQGDIGEAESPLKDKMQKGCKPAMSVLKKAKTKTVDPNAPKLGTKENPVQLNYKEMNKPKGETGSEPTINYAKLDSPPPPKAWESEQAMKRQAKLKDIAVKHPDVLITEKPSSAKTALQAMKEKQKKLSTTITKSQHKVK